MADGVKADSGVQLSISTKSATFYLGEVPKCVYCPRAEFSSAALDKKKEGIVLLIVQITADGIAKDIEFVQGAQYGLTQKAIEAVQRWKFQPAQTPDGKPRAVWQQIQVTFHLY
jgi:protein TonB